MNNIVVGVPFSGCEKHVNGSEMIVATREDEAIAIAVGAWLSGKNPQVIMQDSGIGNSLDIITSLLVPYGINIDLLINKRLEPEHHLTMGNSSEKLLKEVGYESYRYC